MDLVVRHFARALTAVALVVSGLVIAVAAAPSAQAACPVDDPVCGGGPVTNTYTSTLTVTRATGWVTSDAPAISCGLICSVTDSQEGLVRPTDGWSTYTLFASGG